MISKELKVNVGDTVLYCISNRTLPQITKVIKVTPTGRIRIELHPDLQFDKYGRRMSSDIWSHSYIEVPTAEKLQEIKEKTFIEKTKFKMRDDIEISYDQAVAIMEILKGGNLNE